MRKFKGKFYTDDYDQEMLDFVKENYTVDTVNGWCVKNFLLYSNYDDSFYVKNHIPHGVYLTKQQFKEKIGMTNKNTFTKDDLVAGKHVVECRNGTRCVVLEENLLLELNDYGWLGLDDFRKDLTHKGDDEWDIVKVYLVQYKNIHYSKDLPLVWERTEKSDAQLQYEQCKAKMDELQKEMATLEEKL